MSDLFSNIAGNIKPTEFSLGHPTTPVRLPPKIASPSLGNHTVTHTPNSTITITLPMPNASADQSIIRTLAKEHSVVLARGLGLRADSSSKSHIVATEANNVNLKNMQINEAPTSYPCDFFRWKILHEFLQTQSPDINAVTPSLSFEEFSSLPIGQQDEIFLLASATLTSEQGQHLLAALMQLRTGRVDTRIIRLIQELIAAYSQIPSNEKYKITAADWETMDDLERLHMLRLIKRTCKSQLSQEDQQQAGDFGAFQTAHDIQKLSKEQKEKLKTLALSLFNQLPARTKNHMNDFSLEQMQELSIEDRRILFNLAYTKVLQHGQISERNQFELLKLQPTVTGESALRLMALTFNKYFDATERALLLSALGKSFAVMKLSASELCEIIKKIEARVHNASSPLSIPEHQELTHHLMILKSHQTKLSNAQPQATDLSTFSSLPPAIQKRLRELVYRYAKIPASQQLSDSECVLLFNKLPPSKKQQLQAYSLSEFFHLSHEEQENILFIVAHSTAYKHFSDTNSARIVEHYNRAVSTDHEIVCNSQEAYEKLSLSNKEAVRLYNATHAEAHPQTTWEHSISWPLEQFAALQSISQHRLQNILVIYSCLTQQQQAILTPSSLKQLGSQKILRALQIVQTSHPEYFLALNISPERLRARLSHAPYIVHQKEREALITALASAFSTLGTSDLLGISQEALHEQQAMIRLEQKKAQLQKRKQIKRQKQIKTLKNHYQTISLRLKELATMQEQLEKELETYHSLKEALLAIGHLQRGQKIASEIEAKQRQLADLNQEIRHLLERQQQLITRLDMLLHLK